jgi:hypothetical protein
MDCAGLRAVSDFTDRVRARRWRLRIVAPPPQIARAFTLAYMEPGPRPVVAVRDLSQRGPSFSAVAGIQPQANCDKVDDPDDYKGEPIAGGPIDPDAPS